MTPPDPAADLRAIAFCLERALEPTYRVRAFRTAAAASTARPRRARRPARAGTLDRADGHRQGHGAVVAESLAGEEPVYLRRRRGPHGDAPVDRGRRSAARGAAGDCTRTRDWSDGGSPIEEMAATARDLGHEYIALTDHSPRLTVANGLTAERLRSSSTSSPSSTRFADEAAAARRAVPHPHRHRGATSTSTARSTRTDELLAELDVVVASVHSKLRMPRDGDDRADARARSPTRTPTCSATAPDARSRHGRGGKGRPESEFDAEAVFAACAQHGVAVEINSRPERLDPPKRLLRLAVEAGCDFAIDTDAHAPGQLDWQHLGCERARCAACARPGGEHPRRGRPARLDGSRCCGMSASTGSASSPVQLSGTASATSRTRAASRHSSRTRWPSRASSAAGVRQVAQGRDRPSVPVRRTSAQTRRRDVSTAASKAEAGASARSSSRRRSGRRGRRTAPGRARRGSGPRCAASCRAAP